MESTAPMIAAMSAATISSISSQEAEASETTKFNLKIEMCKTYNTKQEIKVCLQKVQNEWDSHQKADVIFTILLILIACFVFWLITR